jgi:hypothetical protein
MTGREIKNDEARFWHKADKPIAPQFVCYWGNNGQKSALGLNGLSANDPTATLDLQCGNGFDAGFSPYQSTRMSRYNAVSCAWGRICGGASSSRFLVVQRLGGR